MDIANTVLYKCGRMYFMQLKRYKQLQFIQAFHTMHQTISITDTPFCFVTLPIYYSYRVRYLVLVEVGMI